MAAILYAGARRLAVLVTATLALVSLPFVIAGHVRSLPAACVSLALALLLGGLTSLTEAQRLLRLADPPSPPPRARMAYRASAREADTEATESLATRHAVAR